MALENVVVGYTADISDVVRNVKQISTINKQLAKQIGLDLSQGFSVINNELKKVQLDKKIKIRTDDGELVKGIGTLRTYEKTVQTADGSVVKFNETVGQIGNKFGTLNSSLTQTVQGTSKLIGTSSQLTTNFKQVSDISQKFQTQLQGFGSVTSVVSSELSKTKDNAKQVNTVIQDSNGQFLKLTETSKRGADGIQSISRSVTRIQSPFKNLTGLSSQLTTNFSNLSQVNQRFNSELKGFGQTSRLVGTSLNQVSTDGSKVSKIFETTNGKFVKLTETTKKLPSGVQNVSRSIQELSKSQAQNANTLENSTKRGEGFTQTLIRLGKRALLTIPIWFALRRSIFGVVRVITDGLKNLSEFDRVLQKLGRNISATSNNFDADFKRLQGTITRFSLETGKSVEEITNAIQKFATVGFDLETSLTGGLQSTKLAITLFGDVEETAQAFARSLRVLTEDMDTTEEKQKAITEALALTDQLWQTNAFEVNEFSNNLEKFAGTANIANLSIEDTLTLLATLSTGGLSNRAGRLLRTTLLKSLQDIEKVTRTLNLNFDPNNQTTIEFILELVGSLKELKTQENVPQELSEIIGELFSVRSTEVVASLVSLEKTLQENIALRPDVEKFEDTFENQLKQINRLADRHKNLNKEMGKAFVTGLLGAENYQGALQTLVDIQGKLNEDTEKFGNIIRDAFLVSGIAGIIGFRKQLLGLLGLLLKPVTLGAIAGFTVLNFKSEAERLAREAEAQNSQFNEIGNNIVKEINKGLRGQLNLEGLEQLIATLETFGSSNLDIDEGTFTRVLSIIKEIRDEEQKITEEKGKQVEASKKGEIADNKRKQISELVLENELEILKTQGASASQIIEAEQSLRKRFSIEKEVLDQLSDQLTKQREINKEKELGNSLSSRTQKLFEIAQREGTETARKISEVLNGQRDFNSFIRIGGKDAEVFKKEFQDIFKAQQALQFFRGERVSGDSSLRGGNRISVALQDEALVNGIGNLNSQTSLSQSRSEAFISRLETLKTPIDLNRNALESNTKSLQDLADIFNKSGVLQGQDARDFLGNQVSRQQNIDRIAQRFAPQNQVIDFNFNINGQNFSGSATPEAIEIFKEEAKRVANQEIDKTFDEIKNNPNSAKSQVINQRIEDF